MRFKESAMGMNKKHSEASVKDLLTLIQSKKEERPAKPRFSWPRLPVSMIILCVLFCALGVMVYSLRQDVQTIRVELGDLKGLKDLKEQLRSLDPKVQIAAVDAKLEESARINETLMVNLARIQADIESLKTSLKKPKK
jgi:hypothetical protein